MKVCPKVTEHYSYPVSVFPYMQTLLVHWILVSSCLVCEEEQFGNIGISDAWVTGMDLAIGVDSSSTGKVFT